MTGVRSGALRTAVTALPFRSGADRLGPGLQPVDRRLDEIVERLRADERVEAAVERPRDVLGPFLRRRVAQLIGRAGAGASCRRAAGHRRRNSRNRLPVDLEIGGEDRFAVLGSGGTAIACGGRGRLDPGLASALLAQAVAEDVEVERAERDQQRR